MSTDQPDRLSDVSLTCATCGVGFVLTVGEQVFFRSKAMHNPKRCKPCRQARAAEQRYRLEAQSVGVSPVTSTWPTRAS